MSPVLAAAQQAFWASTLATVLIVGACVIVVGVTVALVLRQRSRRGSVRERVGEFVAAASAADDRSGSPNQSRATCSRAPSDRSNASAGGTNSRKSSTSPASTGRRARS